MEMSFTRMDMSFTRSPAFSRSINGSRDDGSVIAGQLAAQDVVAGSLHSLQSLPHRRRATIAAIDWADLTAPESRRLRELGFDLGVGVEVLHRAPIGRGPIACRIGRMTVALRRRVAAAVHVTASD